MNALQTSPRKVNRGGFTVTEMIVAATLLVSVFSVVTSLAVRNGRLRQDARHYLVALDELSNQLDRLTALDGERLAKALDEVTPSQHARNVLPSPKLSAETIVDADGRRLVLRLLWDRSGKAIPLTLVGWLAPPPAAAEEAAP